MALTDTTFLDYTAQNLGIFETGAVVDPRFVYNQTNVAVKYTVSRVKFLLVPKVSHLLYSVWGKDNLATYGDYRIDGAALEVEGKRIEVQSRKAQGEEYDRLWKFATEHHPPYLNYQKMTTRPIPIMIFEPIS